MTEFAWMFLGVAIIYGAFELFVWLDQRGWKTE